MTMNQPFCRVVLLLVVPGIAALPGCAAPWKRPQPEPLSDHVIVRDQLVVHSDFPLPSEHRVLEELCARRADLSRRLGLPPGGEPIHVHLFEDADRFAEFMGVFYPQFPSRRAFFVQTDTRLEVYAHWGDRVAEDLRHEVTHAYLHSVVPNLPLWLDEGLAEYFEVPRGEHGLNRAHLESLLGRLERDQWHPNLQRLERLDRPFEMTLDDYAESWAWVHFLLETGPRQQQVLCEYLAALRKFGWATPLGLRLHESIGRSEQAVIDHVWGLGAAGPK